MLSVGGPTEFWPRDLAVLLAHLLMASVSLGVGGTCQVLLRLWVLLLVRVCLGILVVLSRVHQRLLGKPMVRSAFRMILLGLIPAAGFAILDQMGEVFLL